MTLMQAKLLRDGIYFIHWTGDGGTSVASIGRSFDGTPWIAPANWITIPTRNHSSESKMADVWNDVLSVELITTNDYERLKRGMLCPD
jgi:hypothetical protein